ncbi:MAG: prepilin peptidase [Desulfobaccales bacterium]
MFDWWSAGVARLGSHWELFLPLLLSLWMAGLDLASRRIPNYLTLATALAGWGFQMGWRGWPGLLDGLGGAVLGFGLLLWPYLKGGMGAGDVKALAALGAWLGLARTLFLFIYMGLSGGLLILALLAWQGSLRVHLKRGAVQLVNWVLCQSRPEIPARGEPGRLEIPYGAALALGMVILCWRQLLVD